jgi:Predicted Ser/Thr protein kinase
MAHSFISIKKFTEEPYSNILGYPNATNRQIKSRINELEKLKIKSICLTGSTTIGSLAILGKGYVGVVVLVKRGNKEVALKIRRTDSQRENMKNEAVLLKLVNSVNVGPKIIDVSKNYLIMEYLEGEKI